MLAINGLIILAMCVLAFGVYCLVAVPVWLITGDDRFVSRKSTATRVVVGLATISLSFVLLLFAYYSWATRPAAVFKMAFGFEPTADVRLVGSSHYVLGDYGEQSLTFAAAPATIDRILKPRFQTSLDDSIIDSGGIYHFSCEYSETFAVEKAELRYEPATLKAHYSWTGID